MKKRYLGLLAAPMLMAHCQPACTPEPAGPAPTPITAAPPITEAPPPAGPAYLYEISCNPLGVTFTAGGRDIVEQGFGPGPTPQVVVNKGESAFVNWPTLVDPDTFDETPRDEAGWNIVDKATGAAVAAQNLTLAQACPGGWTLEDGDAPDPADFAAEFVYANHFCRRSGMPVGEHLLEVWYDTAAPLGYDHANYEASYPGGTRTWSQPLPQVSTWPQSWTQSTWTPGSVSAHVTFVDDDGQLPSFRMDTNSLPFTDGACN